MLDKVIDAVNIITAIVALASLIAAITPTKKDDAVMKKIKPIVDILALNFGNAKK